MLSALIIAMTRLLPLAPKRRFSQMESGLCTAIFGLSAMHLPMHIGLHSYATRWII